MSNIVSEPAKYHVITLTPEHQYALRVLLYDLFANFIVQTIHESFNAKEEADILHKSHLGVLFFKRYNNMIELLTTENDLEKAESKILTIQPQLFRHLLMAVSTYDPNNSYLNDDDRKWVDSHQKSLGDKLKESSLYVYTEEEIRKVKKEEGV